MIILVLCLFFIFLSTRQAIAFEETNQPHFTIILNQVRGPECCDVGSLELLKQQLAKTDQLDLIANFSLRYDALQSPEFMEAVAQYPQFAYGALLEITPDLAAAAGVDYKGSEGQWFEAQNVFLIGYTQDERQLLIDTYLQQFLAVFDRYPTFSTAWMIDSWSLQYLKNHYGILAHQITREQFGTDSYTLYGGPVHYPYLPSDNWALMPQPDNANQPLIVRQTIMDPVYVYGDRTDAYTSQPNDYLLREDDTSYFQHLFSQAHAQQNNYTFALIGLENSMSEQVHQEYFHQLATVSEWQSSDETQRVVTLPDFTSWLAAQPTEAIKVYAGRTQSDQTEQAWWISTPRYRARARFSDGELSITDLRVYDETFTDPYLADTADTLGWWITPFVLDGSRFFAAETSATFVRNDTQKNRTAEFGQPDRLLIRKGEVPRVKKENGQLIFESNGRFAASFSADFFELNSEESQLLAEFSPSPIRELVWYGQDDQPLWGFHRQTTGDFQRFTPFTNQADLTNQRQEHSSLLFPEVRAGVFSADQSLVYASNRFAVAGRNPVRLIFLPKNDQGESILLTTYPKIETKPGVDELAIHERHGINGMLFIDLIEDQPQQVKVTITKEDFVDELTVYFAPNCKEQVGYCLTHTRQAFWYLRSVVEDKLRAREEARQQELVIE